MSNMPQPVPPPNGFLVDLIPAAQRKRVYAIWGLIGALITLIVAAIAAVTQEMPHAGVIVAVVVYNGMTPFFAALATANATPTGAEAEGLE